MSLTIKQQLDLDGNRIVNVGSPSAATDVAIKSYVDAAIQGLKWKVSVRAASTGNVTLATPGAAIDGVTLSSGDRVLLKDQTAGAENGIYVWTGAATALTRATDADSSADLVGMAVTVEEGTAAGDKVYLLTTNAPITVDTTALVYTQLGGGGASYTAGAGLTLSGVDFAVGAGSGIVVSADSIAVDPNVVTRKYAANVGNGASSSIAVTHNLGSRDVTVEVYTNSGVYDTVLVETQRTDANTVTLVFGTAPASGAYRVVVIG